MTSKKQQILICAGCTLMMFSTVGLATNSFSVFTPFLIAKGILTDTQASLVVTTRLVVSLLSMLSVRVYLKKMGIRYGLTLGILLSSFSFFLFSRADSFVECCFAAIFAGLCNGLSGSVATSILLHRWFDNNLATAIGVAFGGTGAAIVIAPPIFTLIIEAFGVETGFFVTSIFVLSCAVILFPVLRDRETEAASSDKVSHTSHELRVSKKAYYALVFTVYTLGVAGGPGYQHTTVLFTSIGFDSMSVSYFVSCFGIALMVSKFLVGVLSDRIGSYKTVKIFFSLLIIGGVGCCLSGVKVFPFSAATMLIYGSGMALVSVGLSIFAKDISTPESYDRTVHHFQLVYAFGSASFSPVPGFLADTVGSYIPAYIIILSLTIIGAFLTVSVYRTFYPKTVKQA